MSEPLPSDTHIGRVALVVSDLDEVTGFYHDVVGLAIHERTDNRAVLGAGETPLLVLRADPDAAARAASAAGLYHVAFRVPDRAALGNALDRVREQWRLTGASDHLVSEALYLRDPEGNGVEIYRDRPRAEWPEAPEGEVRMATDPLDLEALATDAADEESVPTETDVGHVHLEVAALDTFRSFWVETVGFSEMTTYPGASFVAAGGYHHHLAGNVWNERMGEAGGRGLAWFEVLLPDEASLGSLRDRLDANGVSLESVEAGFETADRDGIGVRFRAEQ